MGCVSSKSCSSVNDVQDAIGCVFVTHIVVFIHAYSPLLLLRETDQSGEDILSLSCTTFFFLSAKVILGVLDLLFVYTAIEVLSPQNNHLSDARWPYVPPKINRNCEANY